MSWVDRNRAARWIVAAVLALPAAGCFTPMYGSSLTSPAPQNVLAAIEVMPVQDRLGQERIGYYVHQELRFELDGGAGTMPKRYRLEMTVNESLQSPVVDTSTGRANSGILTGEVNYQLKEIGKDGVVASGRAVASASYDRNPQRFASLRAARDAEIRLAKQLADQIRTRLAASLAARS